MGSFCGLEGPARGRSQPWGRCRVGSEPGSAVPGHRWALQPGPSFCQRQSRCSRLSLSSLHFSQMLPAQIQPSPPT